MCRCRNAPHQPVPTSISSVSFVGMIRPSQAAVAVPVAAEEQTAAAAAAAAETAAAAEVSMEGGVGTGSSAVSQMLVPPWQEYALSRGGLPGTTSASAQV